MSFLDHGEHEALKGWCHGWLFGALIPVLAYNVLALKARGEPQHWINVGVLTLVLVTEGINMRRHFR